MQQSLTFVCLKILVVIFGPGYQPILATPLRTCIWRKSILTCTGVPMHGRGLDLLADLKPCMGSAHSWSRALPDAKLGPPATAPFPPLHRSRCHQAKPARHRRRWGGSFLSFAALGLRGKLGCTRSRISSTLSTPGGAPIQQ